MSYPVHNFQTGDIIEADPVNEMDAQIQLNEQNINGKISVSEKGAANGIASLDASAHVPASQLDVATVSDTEEIIANYSAV